MPEIKYYAIKIIIISGFLGGCATVPQHNGDTITRADIIRNIKCQLRDALWERDPPPHKWLRNWTTAVTLTLQETNSRTLNGNANFVAPATPQIFGIKLTASRQGEALRRASTDFSVELSSLENYGCNVPQHTSGQTNRPLLKGNLLFYEEFERFLESYSEIDGKRNTTTIRNSVTPEKPVGYGSTQSHSYRIQFTITKNGDLNPTYTMIPVGGDTLGIGGNFKLSNENEHTLFLTLTPPKEKPPEPKATRVIIVEDRTRFGGVQLQELFRQQQDDPGSLSPEQLQDLKRLGEGRPTAEEQRAEELRAAARARAAKQRAIDEAFGAMSRDILRTIDPN